MLFGLQENSKYQENDLAKVFFTETGEFDPA
jgi:hypothetical protein